MKIIFIRHGEPNYEIDSLTEKGWREAELLSKRTAKWNVTDFYCSPLGRAKDTASFTLKNVGREAEILPWLREFDAPVLDPETGKRRIPWDFLPDVLDANRDLYDQDLDEKSDHADRKHGRELPFCDRRTRCTACALRLCTRRLPLSRFG